MSIQYIRLIKCSQYIQWDNSPIFQQKKKNERGYLYFNNEIEWRGHILLFITLIMVPKIWTITKQNNLKTLGSIPEWLTWKVIISNNKIDVIFVLRMHKINSN